MRTASTNVCLLKTVHLDEPKVASRVYSSHANKANHSAEEEVDQCQEELRKADGLAEP